MNWFIVFPFFLKYLANAEYMIKSRPYSSEGRIVVVLCGVWINSYCSAGGCNQQLLNESQKWLHKGLICTIYQPRARYTWSRDKALGVIVIVTLTLDTVQ